MYFLILVLLLILPLGQLGRFDISGTGVVVHINDVFVGLIFLVSAFKTRFTFIKGPLAKLVAIWVLTMVGSLAVNSLRLSLDQIFLSALYIVRWIIYAGLYFVIAGLDRGQRDKLRRILPIPVIIVAILGILQYVFLPDVSFLKALNWDDHYYRVVSTFLDPGFTGIILLLGLFALVAKKAAATISLVTWGAIAIVYLAFALTYSRASFLAYLVGFGVLAWYRKSIKLFAIAVLVLLVTVPLLPKTFGEGTKLGRENSIWARVNNWQQSVEIWRASPIFGVGFNAYRFALAERGYVSKDNILISHGATGADSSILLVLATTGVLGFLAYLNLGRKALLSTKSVLFVVSFCAVWVHSWFNNTLFYPWVMEWLWILLAIT